VKHLRGVRFQEDACMGYGAQSNVLRVPVGVEALKA